MKNQKRNYYFKMPARVMPEAIKDFQKFDEVYKGLKGKTSILIKISFTTNDLFEDVDIRDMTGIYKLSDPQLKGRVQSIIDIDIPIKVLNNFALGSVNVMCKNSLKSIHSRGDRTPTLQEPIERKSFKIYYNRVHSSSSTIVERLREKSSLKSLGQVWYIERISGKEKVVVYTKSNSDQDSDEDQGGPSKGPNNPDSPSSPKNPINPNDPDNPNPDDIRGKKLKPLNVLRSMVGEEQIKFLETGGE